MIRPDFRQIQASNDLLHYGVKHKSGRYPWGSGDRPYQSEEKFHKSVKKRIKTLNTYSKINDMLNDPNSKFVSLERKIFSKSYQQKINNILQSLENDGVTLENYNEKIPNMYSGSAAAARMIGAFLAGPIGNIVLWNAGKNIYPKINVKQYK